jgi:hypothetical protein
MADAIEKMIEKWRTYDPYPNTPISETRHTCARELESALPAIRELVTICKELSPQIGWRGYGENDDQIHYCEYCKQSHEDSELIPHLADCLVLKLRAALAKFEG